MIDFNQIWIFSLGIFAVAFLVLILLSKLVVNPIDNEKVSFSRMFPFEMINHVSKGGSFYKTVIFIFAGMCFSPIFCITNNSGFTKNLNTTGIIISCILGIAGICCSFLFFFNPSNIKAHLSLVAITFGLVLCGGITTGVYSLSIYKVTQVSGEQSIINIVFGSLGFLTALFLVVQALVLKLRDWAKLERKDDVLKRPSIFPLAKFEWIIIFTLFIEEVFFFLTLLKY